MPVRDMGRLRMTNETWGQVREELIERVGKNNYVTWIEPLKLSQLNNGVARFEVPTIFFGDWVQRNYADHIRTQLTSAGALVDRVDANFLAHSNSPHGPRTRPTELGHRRESRLTNAFHGAGHLNGAETV